MIWTLIVAAILIASIAVLIFVDSCEDIWVAGVIVCISSAIVMFLMLGAIVDAHTCVDKKVAALQAEREAIVYQMEQHQYLGGALGKFNANIISQQYARANPWTSWFHGDYIYEVDPIELK